MNTKGPYNSKRQSLPISGSEEMVQGRSKRTISSFYTGALFFFFIFWFNKEFKAQSLANYSSTRNTGVTYASISGTATSFSAWRNLTTYTLDDNRSHFTDIGFDFWYNGVRYTRFSVSTNGFLDFSTSVDDGGPSGDDFGFNNAAFTSATIANSTNPAIAGFYDDLATAGETAALASSIYYCTTGSFPSRTLTVEWLNMTASGNTTAGLNFQIKLVETTGQIIIHYGSMNAGSHTFSYNMGLNGAVISTIPTAAQLKMLQTENTNICNNTIQNNLSVMPAAGSEYIFSPPAPTPTSGGLSFTGISQTGMTLNWTNWASNEVGYIIYNSTDGTNYNFVNQTAANVTSSGISNLLPGTTYFWKLYAVTDGHRGTGISGTQATNGAGTKVSNATGSWNTPGIWTPAGVPSAGDNVIVSNGHVVTINSNALCHDLTIGSGAFASLRFGNNNTPRSFTVNGDILVNALSTFTVNTGSNASHSITISGNVVNNGTINFAPDANSLCNATFSVNADVNISGNGNVTQFNLMRMDLGPTPGKTMNINSTTFSAAANFLTLINGTFKLSTINAVNLQPFSAATTISANSGLWLNSSSALMSTGAGLVLQGKITVTDGTLNIGNANNEDCLATGGTFSCTGGVTNVAGKFYTSGINDNFHFAMSAGTLNVATVLSNNTVNAPFQLTGAGVRFDMSGGLIAIVREGGSGTQNFGYINTSGSAGSVSGGTLQIGTATSPAGQTMNINSSTSVANLVMNSSNATGSVITNSLNVLKDVQIVSGTLDGGSVTIQIGGNWVNTGGSFAGNSGTVTFNSGASQTISKLGGESFNALNFAGTGIKTLSSSISAGGNFTIASGANLDVSAANFQVSLAGNYFNNGTFNTRSGLVLLNGSTPQTIGGSSITNFFNLSLNNTMGAILNNDQNLLGALTLSGGTFNTNSQVFTMVSTATESARIAQITGTGDIIGNVTVQRFAPGGTTGWALFGSPLSSPLTFSDWDDDIAISCPTCPDGYVSNFTSIYSYDETQSGIYDAGAAYVPISAITDNIVGGKGYWVYLGTGSATTTNITLDLTGAVRKNNYTIPLNYTNFGSTADDGWNLITNPYPSPIRWSLLRGATANIDNAIYVYNADLNGGTGGYASYVNGISSPALSSGGIGDTIPMSQAFYVHSTGATGLNALESNKVGGNPTYLKSGSSVRPLLRLNLSSAGSFNDEVIIYSETGAANGFDMAFDAYKMRGQDPLAPFISFPTQGNDLQISGVTPISGTYTTDLKTITGYSGSYTITAFNQSSFPKGTCISLFDKFTSTISNLMNSNYVFTSLDTTTVSRFVLSITTNSIHISSKVTQPTCKSVEGGVIIAQGNSSALYDYYWSINGVLSKTSLAKNGADTLLIPGGGNIDLEMSNTGQCSNSATNFFITNLEGVVAKFSSADTVYFDKSSTLHFINSSLNAITCNWNFGDGRGYSTDNSPSYLYSEPGNYKVSLFCISGTGCTDSTSKIITVLADPLALGEIHKTAGSLLIKTLVENVYNISQSFNDSRTFDFKLFDISGKLVEDLGGMQSDELNLNIDLGTKVPGVYILRISTESETKSVKLLVK